MLRKEKGLLHRLIAFSFGMKMELVIVVNKKVRELASGATNDKSALERVAKNKIEPLRFRRNGSKYLS